MISDVPTIQTQGCSQVQRSSPSCMDNQELPSLSLPFPPAPPPLVVSDSAVVPLT